MAVVNSANDNVICEYTPNKSETKQNVQNGFDSFINCDENMFAVAACKKIAMGNASFSQLFIYTCSEHFAVFKNDTQVKAI